VREEDRPPSVKIMFMLAISLASESQSSDLICQDRERETHTQRQRERERVRKRRAVRQEQILNLFAADDDLEGGVSVVVLEQIELTPRVETHLCGHLSLR
jgi:hypothetical protein